jgi:hypothetical protein
LSHWPAYPAQRLEQLQLLAHLLFVLHKAFVSPAGQEDIFCDQQQLQKPCCILRQTEPAGNNSVFGE